MMRIAILCGLLCAAGFAVAQRIPGIPAPKPGQAAKPSPQMPGQAAPQLPVEMAEGPIIRATVNVVLVPTTVTDPASRSSIAASGTAWLSSTPAARAICAR